jgi:hypothetical protein
MEASCYWPTHEGLLALCLSRHVVVHRHDRDRSNADPAQRPIDGPWAILIGVVVSPAFST